MDRMTFLNELAAGLARLEPADRKQVLDYYSEMILDSVESGIPEAEAVAGLEPPEQIAAQIRVEYGTRQNTAAPDNAYHAVDPDAPLEYIFTGDSGQRMEIRAWDTRIQLQRVAEGPLRVLVYGCREEWLSQEVTEEAFRLVMRPPMFASTGWDMLAAWSSGRSVPRRRIVLELPEGFSGGVSVRTTNSSIEGAGLRLGGKAKLATSCSSITLEDCRFDKLSASTSNSSITLSDLAGRTCKAQTTNSRVTAEDCHFTQKLQLATSNGAVRVADVEAPEIGLATSNGAIKGWIRGREEEYAISSGTSNARNNLPYTALEPRPKRLSAATSNAKIDLRFVPEGQSAD